MTVRRRMLAFALLALAAPWSCRKSAAPTAGARPTPPAETKGSKSAAAPVRVLPAGFVEPRGRGLAAAPTAALDLWITLDAVKFAPEQPPIVAVPGVDARAGFDRASKPHKSASDLEVTPLLDALSKKLGGPDPRPIALHFDARLPQRVLLEVVHTTALTGAGPLYFALAKPDGAQGYVRLDPVPESLEHLEAAALAHLAGHAKDAGPGPSCAPGTEVVLALVLAAEGARVGRRGVQEAPGCAGFVPSAAPTSKAAAGPASSTSLVPKANGAYDWDKVAGCIAKLRATATCGQPSVAIAAVPEVTTQDLLHALETAQWAPDGAVLFPVVTLTTGE